MSQQQTINRLLEALDAAIVYIDAIADDDCPTKEWLIEQYEECSKEA